MADRPILFSGPLIRALLDGRKTQTRRVLKPRGNCSLFDGQWSDSYVLDPGNADWRQRDVRYAPGDRLWVRETWTVENQSPGECLYRATIEGDTGYYPDEIAEIHWRPSIHMPRWASRLTLVVTDVRVQRLQDISEEDARAEGFPITWDGKPYDPPSPEADSWQGYGCASMCLYWNELNAKRGYGWEANPWVAALTFTVHRCNIDQMEAA